MEYVKTETAISWIGISLNNDKTKIIIADFS